MLLADVIKQLLKDQSKTQAELAEYIHVRQSTVSDWVNKKKHPSSEHIYRISDFFNVSYNFLFTGKEQESSSLNDEETSLLKNFRLLDERGKVMVKAATYHEIDRIEEEARFKQANG